MEKRKTDFIQALVIVMVAVSAVFLFQASTVFAEDAPDFEGEPVEETDPALNEPESEELLESPQREEDESRNYLAAKTISAKKSQTVKTPQSVYGVATNAKAFSLNATAKTPLTYKSSNTKIATVTSDGKVMVKNKTGSALISIKAEATNKYNSAGKTVKVRVSAYKTPNGKIAQGVHNYDGRSGDSRGNESGIYRYSYGNQHWKNWGFIIRCTDPHISNNAAAAVNYIVHNKNFGFNSRKPTSQSNVTQRASIYKAVYEAIGKNPTRKDLKKIQNIKTKADTSCTPTVLSGYWLYIDMDTRLPMKWISPYHKKSYKYYCGAVNVENHQLETAIKQVNKEYRSKGMLEPFEIIYVPKSQRNAYFKAGNMKWYLKRGDIVCSCPNPAKGGHTAMIQ